MSYPAFSEGSHISFSLFVGNLCNSILSNHTTAEDVLAASELLFV